MNRSNSVAFARDYNVNVYPSSPFSPSEQYPEYPFEDLSSTPNPVYRLVRQALLRLNLDKENMGTRLWNPLADFIRPGNKVVIKPNWVMHENRGPGGLDAVVTHPSIVPRAPRFCFYCFEWRRDCGGRRRASSVL